MGVLDWLFGGGRGRSGKGSGGTVSATRAPGLEVVPLAERSAERSISSVLVDVTEANEDGRNRQLEIADCRPGDELVLSIEPRPRMQPNAVSVHSAKTGARLGYLPLDVGGYILLHVKRHDFRTVIAGIRVEDDGAREVDVTIQIFRKAR